MDDTRDIGRLRRYEFIGGLCFLAVYLAGGLTRICARLVERTVGISDPLRATMALNLAVDALALLFLILLLHRWLGQQIRLLLENGWRPLSLLLAGFLTMLGATFLMSIPASIVAAAYPDHSNGNQELAETLFSAYPVWAALMSCVTAPLIEELAFRGVVFCGLWRRSRFWAYLLSALLFALPHVSSFLLEVHPAVTAVNLFVYFVHGLILAGTYARSGTVLTSVFLHAAYNLFVLYMSR